MIPLKNLEVYDVILASKSPRRKQLLEELGIKFRVEIMDVDESFPEQMNAADIPIFLAEKKAYEFQERLNDNELVITADTIVAQEGRVLNKPGDAAHAREMLNHLSGKKHQVYTGVCILSKSKKVSFLASTDVWFKDLSCEEIDYYIEHYKPFDKAGAYGIQEWIGYIGIHRIDGSYFNVMGLPVQQLYEHLEAF